MQAVFEEPVRKQLVPVHEQVYRLLREAIVNGRLEPGERLVESRIAAELDVSRAPVREALRKLERDGLVDRPARGGLRVARLSPAQMAELYACRAALERLAAQEAARGIAAGKPQSERAVEFAEEALRLEFAAYSSGAPLPELVAATGRFHDAIVLASGNQYLLHLMSNLRDRIVQARNTSLSIPGNPSRFHEHHRKILDAIRAGDARLAGEYMEEHVRDAGERVTRFLASGRGVETGERD